MGEQRAATDQMYVICMELLLTSVWTSDNIGQNKKEQLTPFLPQSNDEGAKRQKCAILASLKWRGER